MTTRHTKQSDPTPTVDGDYAAEVDAHRTYAAPVPTGQTTPPDVPPFFGYGAMMRPNPAGTDRVTIGGKPWYTGGAA